MIERPKTFNDLANLVLGILPLSEFGEDLDGQVIIYTNLYQKPGTNGEQLCLFDDLPCARMQPR